MRYFLVSSILLKANSVAANAFLLLFPFARLPWEVHAVMLADNIDGYRKQEERLISEFQRCFAFPLLTNSWTEQMLHLCTGWNAAAQGSKCDAFWLEKFLFFILVWFFFIIIIIYVFGLGLRPGVGKWIPSMSKLCNSFIIAAPCPFITYLFSPSLSGCPFYSCWPFTRIN